MCGVLRFALRILQSDLPPAARREIRGSISGSDPEWQLPFPVQVVRTQQRAGSVVRKGIWRGFRDRPPRGTAHGLAPGFRLAGRSLPEQQQMISIRLLLLLGCGYMGISNAIPPPA